MNAIELQIRDFLNDSKDVESAAIAITKSWKKNLYNPKEQGIVSQFFLNAGLQKSFLLEVEKLLKHERHLPWAQLSEILAELQLTPNSKEQRAILTGLREQKAMGEILKSPNADRLSSKIAKARQLKESQELEKRNEAKLALREKIEFLRSQRMMEDEAKALEQYHLTYPDDRDPTLNQGSFDERWARHIVGENIDHRHGVGVLEEKPKALSGEQLGVRKLMMERAQEEVQASPEKNYDLAMTLAFMEFFDEALEILRLSTRTPEAEWFELELLLKSRRYLEALELSQQLEIKFVEDPESSFAAVYARARALWGLGQKAQAIDFMKSIVKIKAHYKNAHSLLNHWLGQS